jgi:hypothetical protein
MGLSLACPRVERPWLQVGADPILDHGGRVSASSASIALSNVSCGLGRLLRAFGRVPCVGRALEVGAGAWRAPERLWCALRLLGIQRPLCESCGASSASACHDGRLALAHGRLRVVVLLGVRGTLAPCLSASSAFGWSLDARSVRTASLGTSGASLVTPSTLSWRWDPVGARTAAGIGVRWNRCAPDSGRVARLIACLISSTVDTLASGLWTWDSSSAPRTACGPRARCRARPQPPKRKMRLSGSPAPPQRPGTRPAGAQTHASGAGALSRDIEVWATRCGWMEAMDGYLRSQRG